MSEGHTIRPAVQSDGAFLGDMVVEAANWRGRAPRARHEILASDEHRRYLAGWMRPADAGVVALDAEGQEIGAAWYRVLPQNDPGLGYVDTAVPELIIGVQPLWRTRGIGREMLRLLLANARVQGYRRVSLSVERDNFAQALYRSEGFVVSRESADRLVMVHRLG
jgi:GNAT superfamily N-acetyltransferase